MSKEITLSVIKADVGGYVGHSSMHEALEEKARELLQVAKGAGDLIDFHVTRCGDDLELIMTHDRGTDNDGIHQLSWDVFEQATEVAKELHLYGAGQDLLADAFSGNVKGDGARCGRDELRGAQVRARDRFHGRQDLGRGLEHPTLQDVRGSLQHSRFDHLPRHAQRFPVRGARRT